MDRGTLTPTTRPSRNPGREALLSGMTREASRTDRRPTTSITRVVGWALLLVSLVPFLPLAYLSWVDYRRNVSEIEGEIQDTNRQLARLAGNYLETFLAQIHRDAAIVTVLPDAVVGLGSPRQGIRWEIVGATRLVVYSQVSATRLGRPCEYDRFLDRLDSRRGVQVSEVGWWRAGSPPSVIVGVRFLSDPRYLVGILEPEVLHRELTAISGDALDRHIYVVDERGGLIFYSDMEISRRGDDLRGNPPIRMHLRREQGPLRFRSVVSGKERLGHVLRLPDTGWGVVVSADMGSRLISLRNRYQVLSWLIAFAMLTALGIFVLTSRRLVRPVLQIREALRRDHRPEHAPLEVPESGRRIAEYDELIEALDSLAERIATTEQQLIQAERTSLLGQMASGIAHEVGTPLNVITGHAQYLMRKLPEDDPTYATLQMIVKQAERIAEMVRRLLGFSHPTKAELMPVDLHELVVQTLDVIAELHEQAADPDRPRSGHPEGARRSETARTCPPEPHDERLPGHARRWQAVDGDRPGLGSGRGCGPRRFVGVFPHRRHRRGHRAPARAPDLRAVLHDEGARAGDRARARHR